MNDDTHRADVTLRRTVQPGDPERIRELVRSTGFFSAEEQAIAEELARETLVKGPASGYEFLFAESADGLVGYSCFGRVPCTVATWDLYWIAVAPGTQGGGLGKRLLQETENRVAAQGGTALYAETSGRDQYAPTRAFYLRCGYDCAAQFEDFYGPGDAKCVFTKSPLTS